MVLRAEIDARTLQSALKALAPEVYKATQKRLRDVAREVRDDVRRKYPYGHGTPHARNAITSGASGIVPYVSRAQSGKYSYVPWLEHGGTRPRDTRARPFIREGRWFFPEVGKARKRILADVEEIVVDTIRKVGLD